MREILDFFRQPFDPSEVEFKIQYQPRNNPSKGLVVAFVDARAYQERLDDAVLKGIIDDWWAEYRLEDKILKRGGSEAGVEESVFYVVSCTLFLRKGADIYRRTDAGEGESLKAAYSDALKRAGVQFGIGRYLYRLTGFWVDIEKNRIPEREIERLRKSLPRPKDVPREIGPKPISEGANMAIEEASSSREVILNADKHISQLFEVLKAKGKTREGLLVLQEHMYKIGDPPDDIEKLRRVYQDLRDVLAGKKVV